MLARIATGLCRDAGVSRVVLSADGRWAWNGTTRELHVGRQTLANDGVEVCAGIIAHEVGHSFLSRYHLARSRAGIEAFQSGWMNALEDTRVERWIAQRYPGVADWLDSCAESAAASFTDRDGLPAMRHTQWAIAACLEGTRGVVDLYDQLHPDARAAVDATRLARVRYRDGFLPTVDGEDWDLDTPERAAAWARVAGLHPLDEVVDPRERHIVRLALDALEFAEGAIIPAAVELLTADAEELADVVAGDPELHRLLEQPVLRRVPDPDRALAEARGGTRPTEPSTEAHHTAALRWLHHTVREQQARVGRGGPRGGAGPAGTPDRSRRPRGDTRPPEPPEPLAPPRSALVAKVERALLETLREERMARGNRHARTGVRPDLRRVLHNEGPMARDPSRWLPAFHRPVRARPDAAFGLLIDCSGSMAGEKAAAAVEAAHVFVEALQRVGVPYWVAGFQDTLIPLAATGCTLAQARAALAGVPQEVRGVRPGGHNRPQNNDDGPCLLAAAALLRQVPAAQRVLLVLSDGHPSGRHSTPEDLHAAVRALTRAGDIDLIGLGIGSDCVTEFYPRHVVVDPIGRLPEAVAKALAG